MRAEMRISMNYFRQNPSSGVPSMRWAGFALIGSEIDVEGEMRATYNDREQDFVRFTFPSSNGVFYLQKVDAGGAYKEIVSSVAK